MKRQNTPLVISDPFFFFFLGVAIVLLAWPLVAQSAILKAEMDAIPAWSEVVEFANAPADWYRGCELSRTRTHVKADVQRFVVGGVRVPNAAKLLEMGIISVTNELPLKQSDGVFFLRDGSAYYWSIRERLLTLESTNATIAFLVLTNSPSFSKPAASPEPPLIDKRAIDTLRDIDIAKFAYGLDHGTANLSYVRLSLNGLRAFLHDAAVTNQLPKEMMMRVGTFPRCYGVLATKSGAVVYWCQWSEAVLELRDESGGISYRIRPP
jgi:hypothetical protein